MYMWKDVEVAWHDPPTVTTCCRFKEPVDVTFDNVQVERRCD